MDRLLNKKGCPISRKHKKRNKIEQNNELREGHLLWAEYSNVGKAIGEQGQISDVGKKLKILAVAKGFSSALTGMKDKANKYEVLYDTKSTTDEEKENVKAKKKNRLRIFDRRA